MKANEARATIPTKHQISEDQRIYTHIDFIANPVALVQDAVPSTFDGNLSVDGEVKVTVKNGALLAKERDVFHALMTLVKRSDFEEPTVRFCVRDVLDLMGWDAGSWGYERFRKAIENLTNVSITIDGPRRWHLINIIGGATIARRPEGTRRSRVTFTDDFWQLCKAQHFKELHPILYELPSGIAPRMLELISAKASDLPAWRVELLTLRDLIPLVGTKYHSPGRVKQNIEPALATFLSASILHGYRFEPEHRPHTVILEINSDYFYSRKHPRRQSTTELAALSDGDRAAVEQLMKRGVTAPTATRLVATYGADEVANQTLHFDYLRDLERRGHHGSAPRGGGWFEGALRDRYAPPAGFSGWKEGQVALQQASADLARGEALEKALQSFLARLDARDRQALEDEAERRIVEGSSDFARARFLQEGRAGLFFKGAFRQVLRERVGKEESGTGDGSSGRRAA